MSEPSQRGAEIATDLWPEFIKGASYADVWWGRNRDGIMEAIEHALEVAGGAGVERAVQESVAAVLRPHSPRPPVGVAWPMTLKDLRALPLQNPAPVAKSGAKDGLTDRYRIRDELVKRIGERADAVNWNTIAREMWRQSAPEGFPPAPARGGRYSAAEASEIRGWLLQLWPARQEMLKLASEIDGDAGIYSVLDTLYDTGGGGKLLGLRDLVNRDLTGYYWENLRAEGLTPEEFVKHAQKYLGMVKGWLSTLDALRAIDPALMRQQQTPEGIDRQLAALSRVRHRIFDDLLRWYTGRGMYSRDVSVIDADMPPGYRLPRGTSATLGEQFKIDGATVPLSVQVAAYNNHVQREKEEQAAKARSDQSERAELAGEIRAILTATPKASGARVIEALQQRWSVTDKYGKVWVGRGQFQYGFPKPAIQSMKQLAGIK